MPLTSFHTGILIFQRVLEDGPAHSPIPNAGRAERSLLITFCKESHKWITSQMLAQLFIIPEYLDNWVVSEPAAQVSSDPWEVGISNLGPLKESQE